MISLREAVLLAPCRNLCLLLFIVVPLSVSAQSYAPQSTLKPSNSLSLDLSSEARAAIDAGIPLVFTCEFAVRQPWWIFAFKSEQKTHRFSLLRHTLSNSYIVKRDLADAPHIFRSITEASNHIASQALMLLESYSSEQQAYSMRISLNKFDLPTPMRLKAFIADAWDIDTGWIVWTSAN